MLDWSYKVATVSFFSVLFLFHFQFYNPMNQPLGITAQSQTIEICAYAKQHSMTLL
jgi:hypothetical protein